MKQTHCVFEGKIARASRSGEWSDVLLAHVADCRSCEEVALVASYLCTSSGAAQLNAELPDAGRIWWKAKIAASVQAMERTLRPIVWARRFALGFCAAVFFVAVVAWWPRLVGFIVAFAGSRAPRSGISGT
jgi:hypothetical protein